MLKIQEVRELIKLIDQSSIDEFKFEQNGSKVTIRKESNSASKKVELPKENTIQQTDTRPLAVEAPAVKETVKTETIQTEQGDEKALSGNENYHTITSPMVGTFYAAPSPESAPYVKVGDKVTEESIVCIVEAMKLMNEIEAEVKGEIVEVLVENGQLVEYGQELFLVKPE